MIIAEGFLWFASVPGITHKNIHIVHGCIVFMILLTLSLIYRASLKSIEAEVLPDNKISVKNIFQMAVEALLNLVRSIVPHHTEDYLPMIAAVFIYIFTSNLLGLIPGLLPPTENLNTNYAVALSIFFYYHYVGLKRVGLKNYMGHFIGPSLGSSLGFVLFRVLFFAPLMFLIEIISHSIRPLSLSLRLFGNIFGDHKILSVFTDLTHSSVLFFVPIVFLAFGIFVSFVQAFVFTLLSSVYVGLAVETHDH